MKDTLAYQITGLYREFLAYTSEELKNLGLSFGQMPLILYIGKHSDCTQAELTRNLGLDWGYSQRSITKLVNSGFLQKEYDPDKAGNCLQLTDTGKKAFERSHEVFVSWDRCKTDTLSPTERETLILLLHKLSAKKTASESRDL